VTYVPYDPSFETPDEGGINGPPDRGSIRARVKPSRVQLAVSKPPGTGASSTRAGTVTVGSQARPGSSTGRSTYMSGQLILIRLIHQTKIRIWYTLGTQDVRKRPTAANARLDQMT
jgi:hypothetical protein